MSGAYVAKPAVVAPITPTPPPGWDLDWPFPGPFPPGYVPEYTFPMSATGIIKVGEAAAVSGSARDHVEFLTNEPDIAVLSATVNGVSREISPASAIFVSGVYWNISDNISFPDLTRADEGGTIVLTGVSAIDGEVITGTVNIAIYAYVYSLNLSGPSEIEHDEVASVTVSLRDHDTLTTSEPTGSTLTWTATLEGAAVGLKFSGDPEFSNSIESVYSDIGTYWGAEESIEFDLDEDEDDGKTVTLSVESTVWGDGVSDTIEIDIIKVYVVSFTASVVDNGIDPTGGYLGSSPFIYLTVSRTPTPTERDRALMDSFVATWDPATAPWSTAWEYDPAVLDQLTECILTAGGGALTADCASCVEGKTYTVALRASPGATNWNLTAGDMTFTVTVVLSDDSEEVFSVVKQLEIAGPIVTAQLTIDVDDAELTWSED